MEEYAKAARELIEFAQKYGLIDRLADVFSSPFTCLVLGASGAGKSSFLLTIQEISSHFIDNLERTHVWEKKRLKIKNARFSFIDTPGHIDYDEERLSAIREAIRAEKMGVINIVSYGFHETETTLSDIFDGTTVSYDYLAARRSQEIRALNEWASLLGATESASFVSTVITKADLWWSKREEVEKHYRYGEYSAVMKEANLPHNVHLYSSGIKKFYGFVDCDGSFDDQIRRRLRAALLSNLVKASMRQ